MSLSPSTSSSSYAYSSPYPSTAPTPTVSSSELTNIQKLIRHVFRSARLTCTHVLPLPLQQGIHKSYHLTLSNGASIILKRAPSSSTRLLRGESRHLDSESQVLNLLTTNTQVPVPARLAASHTRDNPLGSPYLLVSSLTGTPLSQLAPSLSHAERVRIDQSLGAYIRATSALTAATFGPTHLVLAGSGSPSWRAAFLALLEAALRDAEDMLVSVPYSVIRHWIHAHAALLDEVTTSRLVGIDVGREAEVLVDEASRIVVGLRGWGRCVWGDVMMAGVFAEQGQGRGEGFWEGYFGGDASGRAHGDARRILMYTVYRSLVEVVAAAYRPQQGGEELEARRTLNWALNQLAS
ncbi:hypothetical protein K402DRAFT_341123 [Aulographum hederae CBS 113979]|uniref:Aminoglycoside phosphotransferase domain-containing protein n=1 Tax=Aulographum hederae CBS 113979 TaxID=1176131 RepID=A0A6G1GM78_9PEZI|nr:hypothetical protein K402DRAFT_341123 [Aulographum hederae CBS 113979]